MDASSQPDSPEAWLAAVLERSAALVLQGPPGIGKSHWVASLTRAAADQGWQVLRAQPAQAESLLIGSALIDLCDGVSDEQIAALPPVQAAALSAALLRGPRPDGELPPQAVLLGFTSLLRALAAAGPVLVAVDDLQWLDPQTASALAFAGRRLPTAGVGLLLARRVEPAVAEPDLVGDLDSAVPLVRHTVTPLPRTEIEAVLRERVDAHLPTSLQRLAVDVAGGNPLFAIEVARALLARPGGGADADVPLPDSLSELIGRHVSAMPERTRLSLAACSALRKPTVHQLRGLDLTGELAPAERAGLVRIDGHDVTFTHPLYAAAAYQGLPGTQRMQLHARLAGVVDGVEERARHLALGSEREDEEVALALDVARDSALRRGAVEAAVDACRLGLRATPADSPARVPRQILFGRLLYRVGESTLAKHELASAVDATTDPALQARALHELAALVGDTESEIRGTEFDMRALSLAGSDPDLLADIHMGLALRYSHDWLAGVEHARTAIELLQGRPEVDPQKLAAALTSLVGVSLYAGLGADFESCRRAVELEGDAVSAPVSDRALSVLFYLQFWTDDFPAAREQMQYAHQVAADEGDEASRAYVLSMMGELELRAGRWKLAGSYLDECLRLCERTQNVYFGRVARHRLAWVAALRGDLAPALAISEEEVQTARAAGDLLAEIRALALLGFCSAMRGDGVAAAAQFDRYTALFAQQNAGEPALRVMAGDHVEALVAVGRLDDARAALDAMTEPARRLDRTAILAAAARAEAALRAAEGDGDAAVQSAQQALDHYDRIERPLDRARTLLVKGQVHRRFKQKSLARRELTAAAEQFAALGAAGFAARAGEELRRVGLRPAAPADLTETERRIAELTATGLRSAEVAATLFLSTKTVSGNLTRVYRKLGVRNRAELANYLAQHPAEQQIPDIAPA